MAILREISVNYIFTEIDCDLTGKKMTSPELVYKVFNFLKFEAKERFIVINLNNQHGIMNYEVVAIGTVNSVQLRPVEVLRTAVIINAPCVVLAHNHPSGGCSPSTADIAFTNKVIECGKLLGIEVLDHVIIGESDFYSLKQNGDM
ncbi:MAG: DNA repair protein RadC [Colwellia sp.]|nr:DNA repair protein RadC [Colwellia sp.]